MSAIFKRSDSDDVTYTPPTVTNENTESTSSNIADEQLRGYALFLDKLKDPSAAQIVARVKLFVSRFPLEANREIAAEGLHKYASSFFHFSPCARFISRLEEEIPNIEIFTDGASDDYLNTKEGLEKLILKPLHQHVFSIDSNDKLLDEQLSQKITRISPIISLHKHLHGPSELQDDSLIELSIQEFQRIDLYRAPRDKLQCILNGFRVIRHSLDTVIGVSKWGADQLLPVCIYAIIRANPPCLLSNVNFITHFRHPSRLRGEDEYLLMQMNIAIKDILSIDEILLKDVAELTISDVALMHKRVSEFMVREEVDKFIGKEWKIGEIDKFFEVYREIVYGNI